MERHFFTQESGDNKNLSDCENRLGEPVWKIARVKETDVSKDGLSRSWSIESKKTFRTTHCSA